MKSTSLKIDMVAKRILNKASEMRELCDQICELHLNQVSNDDHGHGMGARTKRFADAGVLMIEKELEKDKKAFLPNLH